MATYSAPFRRLLSSQYLKAYDLYRIAKVILIWQALIVGDYENHAMWSLEPRYHHLSDIASLIAST
jgi:hypothetical protein